MGNCLSSPDYHLSELCNKARKPTENVNFCPETGVLSEPVSNAAGEGMTGPPPTREATRGVAEPRPACRRARFSSRSRAAATRRWRHCSDLRHGSAGAARGVVFHPDRSDLTGSEMSGTTTIPAPVPLAMGKRWLPWPTSCVNPSPPSSWPWSCTQGTMTRSPGGTS
jgi:hypothetical protein